MRKLFMACFLICCGMALNADPMGMNQTGMCDSLTVNEQDFANRLSAANQGMFCRQFNAEQRRNAMSMASTPDMNGNMMAPDQAVDQVARNNNLSPLPAQSQAKAKGCPVK